MKNKLDPFAERLLAWRRDGKSLKEILRLLRKDGCSSSSSAVSDYLEGLEQKQFEQEFLAQLATAGRMKRQIEEQFAKNPAPAIAQLIEISRALVVSLNARGMADPKLVALANSYQQTILNYLDRQTRARLRERELEEKRLSREARMKADAKKLEQSRVRLEVVICERFLDWWKDEKARAIADSQCSNAQKIAQLRQTYFADVEAMEKAGTVQLPE